MMSFAKAQPVDPRCRLYQKLDAIALDARLKCLTEEYVQQLATLHGRPLPSSASAISPLPEDAAALTSAEGPPTSKQEHGAVLIPTPPSAAEVADLRTSLASLETKVATLQEQLTQLALHFLRERELGYEQRLMTLESLLQQLVKPCPSPHVVQETNLTESATINVSPERRLVPAELHARSRVTPLIEYGAQGLYVAVCPQEGVLSLTPDSPAWFDWLASLTSFRFVGPPGRFTAYRASEHGQRTRCWTAHRFIHGRHYKHYLGVTDHLTLTRLEQMAAQLQSHLPSL